ncbi:HNH endonuclease family protein [Streptomyces johnsoniae]|uniref:HNH endonuclease family protein n=1 Tax=Streptomyces johnsoniae TaxID=3075532 RepID=A0ABU2RZD0_9ACTN|nr:HNH endonuclease family protein [Streptomyces sp. DSM 41886]MDT0441781.1 HNH endonuclease family protein [Streptomyces sp. DSM 41886]
MRARFPAAVVAVVSAAVLTAGGCGAAGTEDADGADGAAGTGGTSGAPQESGTRLPGLPDAATAADRLAALTVAEPRAMTGYSRDRFPHWDSADGCTVRQTVLRRDGEDVTVDDDCRPVSGTWFSAYDGEEYTDDGDIDIDHVVPLANAWRSGADAWTDDERSAFANDLAQPQLIAVGSGVNREKGDQSPDAWLPPAEEFGCTYALAWTTVKHAYELTVTTAERDRLAGLLDTCG